MYVQDEQFGYIVDFDRIRGEMHQIYDQAYPEYNLLAAATIACDLANNEASYATTIGASGLAYSIIVAAEEYEIAAQHKNAIFTLGWTEEHCGSDLLSIRTQASALSDDPNERNYHIKGKKWLINCSYHADYHVILAKLDPNQDGPRSLSFFLVPRSSVISWKRIETHVMTRMVLTEFEIDGPGILLGKPGHGLSILQRMAMPSKYQCCYIGVAMMRDAVPATIAHLNRKEIFKTNPIQFSNVFRQLYEMVLKSAFYDFMFHRNVVFNGNGFLQFHGTLLKSFLLLRINELLSKNLLVAGSMGFTKDSVIGRNMIDSFVLPVFDGHYTINTLMTAKHAPRYLNASEHVSVEERIQRLREEIFIPLPGGEISNEAKELRKPPFFDYVDYINQFALPIALDAKIIINAIRDLLAEIQALSLTNDPDAKYKLGDLLHWAESIMAACELWKLTGEDQFLNVIVMQYNGFVQTYNTVISEGPFSLDFLQPMRQNALPSEEEIGDHAEFLLRLLNLPAMIQRVPTV